MIDPVPHHRFHLQGRQGQLQLELSATLTAPWTVLFGPSGSGKSSILRALAGLLPGRLIAFERNTSSSTFSTAEGQATYGLDASPGTVATQTPSPWQSLQTTQPEHRRIAYAPQGGPLFPHLTAAENVRFPETLRRIPATSSRLPELTTLLDLAPLLPKHPHQLSGGERQRVSLARALAVPQARFLLLDEPFAGLDRTLRDTLLPRLRLHLAARNLPVLSVTHDPDEALLLQAEVLRVNNGRLAAQGPAPLILADEVTRLRQLLNGV